MESKVRVAVAQIHSELLQLDVNVEKHRHYIEEAATGNASILLFPELSLTGYQTGRHTPDVAMVRESGILSELAQVAPEMTVVLGFVEEAGPGELYNSMAFLQNGEVVHVHRKINLPTYGGLEEGKWFHAGNDVATVCTNAQWQATCLTCADLWNPALTHCALLKRPDLLLAPINSASGVVSEDFSNERNWVINISFYAMMYGTPVLMANRVGGEVGLNFWGGSRIVGPRGEILATAGNEETLVYAELDRKQIGQARFDMPTVRDANTKLIRDMLLPY